MAMARPLTRTEVGLSQLRYVEPFALLDDDLLPGALTPVEPAAFALSCVQALRGVRGRRN